MSHTPRYFAKMQLFLTTVRYNILYEPEKVNRDTICKQIGITNVAWRIMQECNFVYKDKNVYKWIGGNINSIMINTALDRLDKYYKSLKEPKEFTKITNKGLPVLTNVKDQPKKERIVSINKNTPKTPKEYTMQEIIDMMIRITEQSIEQDKRISNLIKQLK